MTAAWKQKKFERIAQKDIVDDLKNQVMLLKEKVAAKSEALKLNESRIIKVLEQRDELREVADCYYKLRSQEVMVITPEGFKLVTGEELDNHCGRPSQSRSFKYSYAFGMDDPVDTWNYARQLQQSILYGTSIVKMGIENVFNTGSESKETNQENS